MADTDREMPKVGDREAVASEARDPRFSVAPALRNLAAPSIGPASFPEPPRALTPVVSPRHEPQHGAYLAASGTLTQFNALMAAILTPALATVSSLPLRTAIALALFMHTFAALLLCWAARPVDPRPKKKVMPSGEDMAADTFRSYRRGWIVTMLAMGLSAVALTMFAVDTLGGVTAVRSFVR